MNKRYIIRIKCADRIGLVYIITRQLFEHRLNIVELKEFVDVEQNVFFARAEVMGIADIAALRLGLQNHLPENADVEVSEVKKKNLVLLVTKEYHCLGDLLLRHYHQELKADIKAVIGNYESLADLTSKFGIPFHFVDHQAREKADFESEILQKVALYEPDYLVLAKFMRILSPGFVEAYKTRIVNIHHSFLPAFIGAHPYKQAYERGVKLIGATAHFVNNNLDEGPIIAQKIIPVDHEYTVRGMVEAGHEIEKSVLFTALKLILDERVFVHGNKTVIFD